MNRTWQGGGCAGLCWAALSLCACDTTLVTGLDEAGAERVLAALDEAAVPATRAAEPGGGKQRHFRVEVASNDVAQAVSILQQSAALESRDRNLETLRSEPALIPTRSEENARQAAVLGLAVSQAIEALPGVARAHVQLSLPVTPAFAEAKLALAPSASVLLESDRHGTRADHAMVQRIVASSVRGLAADAVSVIEVTRPPVEKRDRVLTRLGPITVTRRSAPVLQAVLAAGLLVQIVLALGLVAVLRRARRMR